MPKVHLDFETRSAVDLKKAGAAVYAAHPTTSILCKAMAVDAAPVQLFKPDDISNTGMVFNFIHHHAKNPDTVFTAHNALFEQLIWKYKMEPMGYPPIPPHRWRCTAAKAAAMSLPRDLQTLGLALGLTTQKDKEGHRIMLKLSKPRRGRYGGELVFWEYDDCPDDFETLYKYNITDVESEREADNLLPPLNEREQRLWLLDQKINQRGMTLDVAAANQVIKFIERTVAELTEEFQKLVNYEFNSPNQVAQFRKWLDKQGYTFADLQKATITKHIDKVIKPHVRRALEIRQELSKISTAKYQAMLSRVSMDGRIRDMFMFRAALTGRWGGRGVQPQNLPRGVVNSDEALNIIMMDDYNYLKDVYVGGL